MEVLDAECARLRQFTEAALATLMEDSWIVKHLYLWFSAVISLSRLVHQILLCLWEEPVFSLRDSSTWEKNKNNNNKKKIQKKNSSYSKFSETRWIQHRWHLYWRVLEAYSGGLFQWGNDKFDKILLKTTSINSCFFAAGINVIKLFIRLDKQNCVTKYCWNHFI